LRGELGTQTHSKEKVVFQPVIRPRAAKHETRKDGNKLTKNVRAATFVNVETEWGVPLAETSEGKRDTEKTARRR